MERLNGSKNGLSGRGNRYSFADIELDPANRNCSRDGVSLPISGKAFDILLAFVENPGRLLSKDELIERVWPGEFVEEGNLARNVSTLRKVLGDTEKQHRYILTVPGHGYRFVAEVESFSGKTTTASDAALTELPQAQVTAVAATTPPDHQSRKLLWILSILILLFTAAWFGRERLFTPSPTVRSLAVLPLRGIDPNDNYLGVGIADAVIRRISSSGQVTVRPTSSVLHYLNQDADTLAAAHELNVDAILEGNVQRSGDRLRVSVNLLRSADGSSIWNDNFELKEADIFRIQDEVAQQVASRLQLHLDNQKARVGGNKYPANLVAYEPYMKGIFALDQRGYEKGSLPQMLNTIDYFKKSIDADPNYALAHAQLAFAYVWTALFIEPSESKWVDLTKAEIQRSQELDPNLAETHIAQGLLFWSAHGGYQIESAAKEFIQARQIDPNIAGADLAATYGHMGLETQATQEMQRALSIDPTSESLEDIKGVLPYLRGDPDGWLSVHPNVNPMVRGLNYWYCMRKGLFDDAQKLIDTRMSEDPDSYDLPMQQTLLLALKGDFVEAENKLPELLAQVPRNSEDWHHEAYDAACIYALDGKNGEAVKWLRETANTGFPNYPLFARDPFLDRIRQSPDFVQFLAEQKAQYERFQQEFPPQ